MMIIMMMTVVVVVVVVAAAAAVKCAVRSTDSPFIQRRINHRGAPYQRKAGTPPSLPIFLFSPLPSLFFLLLHPLSSRPLKSS